MTGPGARPGQAAAPAPAVRPALPLLSAALASAFFIGMDATVKTLGDRFDALQLTFLRFAAGCLFALPLWCWFRSPMPARGSWPLHALRSVLLLLALLCWFHSLRLLPLVEAVAIGYTAPIFISLLAMLLLREKPSRWIWAALALGAAGTLSALWGDLARDPQTAADGRRLEGLLAALVSAVLYAGVVVLARHQAQRDALWTILLIQNVLPAVLLGGVAAWQWQPMQAADLAPVLLMGLLATAGLMAITWAFTHIEASRAAPVEYTGFIWAALLGYGLFGEVPSPSTLASAGLIVAGCLLLVRR
jgi:S-adenosylmethionine uptake transporter